MALFIVSWISEQPLLYSVFIALANKGLLIEITGIIN